jgi:hypothetical protein
MPKFVCAFTLTINGTATVEAASEKDAFDVAWDAVSEYKGNSINGLSDDDDEIEFDDGSIVQLKLDECVSDSDVSPAKEVPNE